MKGFRKLPYSRASLDSLVDVVAAYFGYEASHLTGPSHKSDVVYARHIGMFLAWKRRYPLNAIARAFGRKHHTTALHAARKVQGYTTGEFFIFDREPRLDLELLERRLDRARAA
jgi:chromosomal replication initiation ATPase DnaA